MNVGNLNQDDQRQQKNGAANGNSDSRRAVGKSASHWDSADVHGNREFGRQTSANIRIHSVDANGVDLDAKRGCEPDPLRAGVIFEVDSSKLIAGRVAGSDLAVDGRGWVVHLKEVQGKANWGLMLALCVSVCAQGSVLAQTSAPAPDEPSAPLAAPAAAGNGPRTMIQSEVPAPAKPEAERRQLQVSTAPKPRLVNRRLILKDGSYQVAREYQVVGSRVRYLSAERGDWEELPTELVDWTATRRWEQQQVDPKEENGLGDAASPAMKEAAELDREEARQRAAVEQQMPEVAPGLRLPDRDGVFALDRFQGKPELVEIAPATGTLETSKNSMTSRFRSMVPLAGQHEQIAIDGDAAKVQLHAVQPTIYLSLDAADENEVAPENAKVVSTGGAARVENHRGGAASEQSGFAIVRVDQRKAMRIVGNVRVSGTGKISQSEVVEPVTSEVVAGKHWLKLTPSEPLAEGEYALVQILSPTDISEMVWDFSIHLNAPRNEGGLEPILKPVLKP